MVPASAIVLIDQGYRDTPPTLPSGFFSALGSLHAPLFPLTLFRQFNANDNNYHLQIIIIRIIVLKTLKHRQKINGTRRLAVITQEWQ